MALRVVLCSPFPPSDTVHTKETLLFERNMSKFTTLVWVSYIFFDGDVIFRFGQSKTKEIPACDHFWVFMSVIILARDLSNTDESNTCVG